MALDHPQTLKMNEYDLEDMEDCQGNQDTSSPSFPRCVGEIKPFKGRCPIFLVISLFILFNILIIFPLFPPSPPTVTPFKNLPFPPPQKKTQISKKVSARRTRSTLRCDHCELDHLDFGESNCQRNSAKGPKGDESPTTPSLQRRFKGNPKITRKIYRPICIYIYLLTMI